MKKIIFATCLLLLAASSAVHANEWNDPKWLQVQTVNTLTEKHGFKLISVTSVQNAIHYHLEKGNRGSKFTYVTCISAYDVDSARHLHCFKP